jgi:hypothetical protein
MSDIFISYKREEQLVARRLADALQKMGWSVWWDPKLRAGERFDDAIEEALKDAKSVIVMWSKLSVQSRYVRDEATFALNRNKLVPIQTEEVNLPFRFEGIQTTQLMNWDGSDNFPGFQKLIADLKSILGEPSPEVTKEDKEAGSELSRNKADKKAKRKGSLKEEAKAEPVTFPIDRRAFAITMINETGKPRSYTAVYPMGDDDLYYGQCFASLKKSSLLTLLQTYCENKSARFALQIKSYLPKLQKKDPELLNDEAFKTLLTRVAGEDPTMVNLQDQIIEQDFLGPARKECFAISIKSLLGFSLIADTIIHNGYNRYSRIKLSTIKALDGTPATGVNEQRWLKRFAEERIASFASNQFIAGIVKERTYVYIQLMDNNKWDLTAPVRVRGYILVDS